MARYFFRCVNENAVAGFETNASGVVTKAAPIIRRQIFGLDVSKALERLKDLGWEVENWSENGELKEPSERPPST